ncbi:MAG TPA: hypothetical protein VNK41_03455 [Vicinamibacterales bacterium]|nr:hypothetical protein [Vicinamibacterales bacterium]
MSASDAGWNARPPKRFVLPLRVMTGDSTVRFFSSQAVMSGLKRSRRSARLPFPSTIVINS